MYRPVAYTRIVRPVAGSPRIRMNLSPMRDHGAEPAPTTRGTNHIRYLVGNQPLRLTTDAPVGYLTQELAFRVESDLHFFLGPDEPFTGNVRESVRSEEHTSELQSLMRISYAVFCLKKKNNRAKNT